MIPRLVRLNSVNWANCKLIQTSIPYNHNKSLLISIQFQRYSCNLCEMRFTAACHLRRHLSKHVDSRNFPCELCTKTFNCYENLKRHQAVHSKTKDHVCENCGETFLWRASLNRHLLKHTGLRPYECKRCNKNFITIYDLNAHNKLHSGVREFICSECGMQFARSSGLNAHSRTAHSELRQFKCEVCGKGFKMKHALLRHMRNHTGKEIYKCNICGQGFKWHTSRKLHMKKHNKAGNGPIRQRRSKVSQDMNNSSAFQNIPSTTQSVTDMSAIQHTVAIGVNPDPGEVVIDCSQQQGDIMEQVTLSSHEVPLPRVSVAQVPMISMPIPTAMLDHSIISPVIINPGGDEPQKIYIDFHPLQTSLKPMEQSESLGDHMNPQQ